VKRLEIGVVPCRQKSQSKTGCKGSNVVWAGSWKAPSSRASPLPLPMVPRSSEGDPSGPDAEGGEAGAVGAMRRVVPFTDDVPRTGLVRGLRVPSSFKARKSSVPVLPRRGHHTTAARKHKRK
jgi:hypothetical protein